MIDILLATYNGETYITELLNSLEKQTCQEWRLIVSDDRSKDATVERIREFAATSKHEVELHENAQPTGSAKANFFQMFRYAQSPYIMLCDQDDIWLETKLEKTLQEMKKVEEKYGENTPALVNADLVVVDGELKEMDHSFFHYSNYTKTFSIPEQLIMNKVTGCTVMINRALLSYLNRETIDPKNIMMHDSWLALIAQCFGRMSFVDEGLILYRQHGVNSVGAPNTRSFGYKLKKAFSWKENAKSNMDHIIEVDHFCEVYHKELEKCEVKSLLEGYGQLKDSSRRKYRKYCKANGILKSPRSRAIAQMVYAHK